MVERDFRWIFRRITERDVGLDAEVEVVVDGEAMGLLVGVQVKAGQSYFDEPTERGWRFRGAQAHLKYWRECSLPVVVVLVDPTAGVAYWAPVSERSALSETEKGFTIEVPRNNVLDVRAIDEWFTLAWSRAPHESLFRYCSAQSRFIDAIVGGGRVFVEIEEWVNKTRGQAKLRAIREDPAGVQVTEELFFFAGVRDVPAFVSRVFPWADVEVDEGHYDVHEDVPPDAVFQDSESPGGYYVFPGKRPSGVRPYADNGEVASWRLELTLNEIGQSFVTLTAAARSTVRPPPYEIDRALRATE